MNDFGNPSRASKRVLGLLKRGEEGSAAPRKAPEGLVSRVDHNVYGVTQVGDVYPRSMAHGSGAPGPPAEPPEGPGRHPPAETGWLFPSQLPGNGRRRQCGAVGSERPTTQGVGAAYSPLGLYNFGSDGGGDGPGVQARGVLEAGMAADGPHLTHSGRRLKAKTFGKLSGGRFLHDFSFWPNITIVDGVSGVLGGQMFLIICFGVGQ